MSVVEDIYAGMTTAEFNNAFYGPSCPRGGASAEEEEEARRWREAHDGVEVVEEEVVEEESYGEEWWDYERLCDLVKGYNTRYWNNMNDWYEGATMEERMAFMELDDAVNFEEIGDDCGEVMKRFSVLFSPGASFVTRFFS